MRYSRPLALVLVVLFAAVLALRILGARDPGWRVQVQVTEPLANGGGVYRQFRAGNASTSVEIDCVALPQGHYAFSIADVLLRPAEAPSLAELAVDAQAAVACNGGYFDLKLQPLGLFVVGGQMVARATQQEPLSGIIGISSDGTLRLTSVRDPLPSLQYALQAGPFLIGPGGQIGVRSNGRAPARRTFIATSDDGTVIIGSTSEVRLDHLAQILASAPQALGVSRIERALNLDGGPSNALFIDRAGSDDLYHRPRGAVRGVILVHPGDAPAAEAGS